MQPLRHADSCQRFERRECNKGDGVPEWSAVCVWIFRWQDLLVSDSCCDWPLLDVTPTFYKTACVAPPAVLAIFMFYFASLC
jgi:hypothetical protein